MGLLCFQEWEGRRKMLMHIKNIFVFLLVGIFMISMASAFEFDNVKSYDPITRTATINDCALWVGVCLIEGDEIVRAMLESPLNVNVGAGEDKLVGWFNYITTENDVVGSFGDLYLEDLKNSKMMSRGKQYKVWLSHEEKVDDFDLKCFNSISINGTNISQCDKIIIGSHIETVWEWKPITNPNINLKPNTLYKIGIFVDVEVGDHGDWRPTFAGKVVKEWATWTASLNVNIEAYYKAEDTVVDMDDATPNGYDCGAFGSLPTPISAVIDNGQDLDGNGDYFNCGDIVDGSVYTINFWANPDAIENNFQPMSKNVVGNSGWRLFMKTGDFLRYEIQSGASEYTIDTAESSFTSAGGWYMVTLLRRANQTAEIYLNGVSAGHNDTTTYTSNDVDFIIGGVSANNFDGQMDEIGFWNRDLSPAEINDIYNGGSGLQYVALFDQSPNITLNSPSSANYSTTQTPQINFTAYDNINLTDVKLYVNDILNQTNASGINDTDYLFDLPLGDGDYTIYGKATDNASFETNSSSIRIVIDSTSPTITSAYNLTDLVTLTLPINSTWHYNASDLHIDKCYYNSTANATQTIITCNSTINTTWTTEGNKTIQFCANDTFGLESCNTEYVYIYYIQETQADSPDPIAESFDATFNFTVNLTNIPTTTATLVLNNTIYAPTTTTAGTNGYYFEVTVTIPDGWGSTTGIAQNWSWNYTIDGVTTDELTDTENITVYELGIDNCSSYGELIFNFSVVDEETLVEANETLTIDVEADLTLTSKSDATQYISYSNEWSANNNPQICVPNGVINNSQYWIDLTVGFSSTDHVWEFYYMDSGTLNSTKLYENFNGQTNQNINLMDLLTADSTSFLFNYFDVDGLAVDGSVVHVMRKYIGSGLFREVERAKQDQNGDTIVHLVEEDVIYYFMITLDGVLLHTSSEYTALCQATPCTIQIEASGGSATFPTDWDLMDGGAYTITSSASTRNVTLTYTNNVSTDMNFTIYKYESDGSYSEVETGNDTGTSGSITLTVPQVAGNVSFFATVTQDNSFLNSEWVNFESDARDRFGTTLAVFLGALIILTLGLFAVSEGVGTIVYIILGVVISGALGLIITDLSTGVNIVIYLVLAGGILLWKLTGGRR